MSFLFVSVAIVSTNVAPGCVSPRLVVVQVVGDSSYAIGLGLYAAGSARNAVERGPLWLGAKSLLSLGDFGR